MTAASMDYLVWSNEHRRWWGPGERGYVKRVSEAGRYTREHALAICRGALFGTAAHIGMFAEIPVRESDVHAFIVGGFMPADLV